MRIAKECDFFCIQFVIRSYDRQHPYTETKYSDFDKFLFSSWENKPNGKGKDQIQWGVPVD